MFRLLKERTTWIDVKFPGLDAEGSTIENLIRMQVVLLKRDDLTSKLETPAAEFIPMVSRDWSGVATEDGVVAPFTSEHLAAAIQEPAFAEAFSSTYLIAWQGIGKEREKNSEGSPENGRAEAA